MPPGTAHVWHLGNDIVDLRDSRHEGKARDLRFLRRVLSDSEQRDIRQSPDPDQALWIRWAGKEAAFKTVSKSVGTPPVFVHSCFRVTLPGPVANPSDPQSAPPPMTRFGHVEYQDLRLPLRIEVNGRLLHALTWIPHPGGSTPPFSWGAAKMPEEDQGWKRTLEPRFSPAEWECISHRASALARMAARQALADTLTLEEGSLEIRCGPGSPGRRIPQVFSRDEILPVDLTLSHHGHYLAWAFLTTLSPRTRDQTTPPPALTLNPRADT